MAMPGCTLLQRFLANWLDRPSIQSPAYLVTGRAPSPGQFFQAAPGQQVGEVAGGGGFGDLGDGLVLAGADAMLKATPTRLVSLPSRKACQVAKSNSAVLASIWTFSVMTNIEVSFALS